MRAELSSYLASGFHFFLQFRHKPSAESKLKNLLIRPIFMLPVSVFAHLRAAQGDPCRAHSKINAQLGLFYQLLTSDGRDHVALGA